jgi:hypothetical protein
VSDPPSDELMVSRDDVDDILTKDMRLRAESMSELMKGEADAGGVGIMRDSRIGRALVGVRSTSSASIKSNGSTDEREEGVDGDGEGDMRLGPHE